MHLRRKVQDRLHHRQATASCGPPSGTPGPRLRSQHLGAQKGPVVAALAAPAPLALRGSTGVGNLAQAERALPALRDPERPGGKARPPTAVGQPWGDAAPAPLALRSSAGVGSLAQAEPALPAFRGAERPWGQGAAPDSGGEALARSRTCAPST